MKALTLPDDIFGDEAKQEIIIHDYSTTASAYKERSILTKNAISLVVKGQKTMYFAERKVEANDNEIHFLSAGNCVVSIDISAQSEFRSILLFFDDKLLTDFFIKNNLLVKKTRATIDTSPQKYVPVKKDVVINHFIESLQLMLKSNKALSTEMMVLKFNELLLYLLETYPQSILSFYTPQDITGIDIEIRKTVETNIFNNLSVDELAFLCNLSSSTFKRYFQKIYNTSPINWFLEQRMKEAARLLSLHNTKPSEVFYKVGYENHSSFTKSFKKFYGVTPKMFQEESLTV